MGNLTDKQYRYLKTCKKLGRFLNNDEVVEYYVENHMKNDVSCRFNSWAYWGDKERGKKPKRKDYYDDYPYEQLKIKAMQWHRSMVGQLVLRGAIETKI